MGPNRRFRSPDSIISLAKSRARDSSNSSFKRVLPQMGPTTRYKSRTSMLSLFADA